MRCQEKKFANHNKYSQRPLHITITENRSINIVCLSGSSVVCSVLLQNLQRNDENVMLL